MDLERVNRERVLVDTGPLVAMLNRTDEHHQLCIGEAKSLGTPLLTSWPVLTEAAWLLRSTAGGVAALLAQVSMGLVEPVALDHAAAEWMRDHLQQYRDLKTQLADASLCYLAQRDGISQIFTLDRRDFTVFRTSQNRPFTLLPASLST